MVSSQEVTDNELADHWLVTTDYGLLTNLNVLAGQGLWPPPSHGGDRGFESHLGIVASGQWLVASE